MSVIAIIETALKEAMKAKDTEKLGTLRMIKAELKNKEIVLRTEHRELNDADFNQVLSRMVKQRKESVEQYKQGGREDLAEKEAKEIDVISEFLPKALTEAELEDLISKAVEKTGAQGPQGMGLVMKELKEVTTGRVDGKLLADKVKAKLA